MERRWTTKRHIPTSNPHHAQSYEFDNSFREASKFLQLKPTNARKFDVKLQEKNWHELFTRNGRSLPRE
jgi:hypothetical protein